MGSGSTTTKMRYEDKVYVDPPNERNNTDIEMGYQKPKTEPAPGTASLLNADDETPKKTNLIG